MKDITSLDDNVYAFRKKVILPLYPFVNNFYRRRYAEKEWTKKVDISILFRLEKATARIKTIADRDQLKPILEEVEQLELALNIAQGRVKDFPLKEHEMPEDSPKTQYRKSTRRSKAASKPA